MEKSLEQQIIELKVVVKIKDEIILNDREIIQLKDDIISKLNETIKMKDEIFSHFDNKREEVISILRKVNQLQDSLILKQGIIIERMQSKLN